MELQRLIEAVECGDAVPRHFNAVWNPYGPEWPLGHKAALADEGSLDAAKALHDALLPGWRFEVRVSNAEVWNSYKVAFSAEVVDNPARSWLLAILNAYHQVQLAT